MQMVNKAKEELKDTLRHNDAIREEESVLMEHNTIIISSESLFSDDSLENFSDDSSDSGRRKISTKPVMSSNNSSTFPAKHKSDNEETSLKQPHQDAFTSKQEILKNNQ